MGRTGLQVSEICLGTMTFGGQRDKDTSFAIMDAALEGGVNFFDTADAYPLPSSPDTNGRTEEILGAWLRERRQRERIVLATKCYAALGPGPNDRGLSRKHILEAVEGSLRRLGTDYIDLYQSHHDDRDTPLDETLRAFDDLVRSGKVRYIGASNYVAWRFAGALWTSDKLGIARYDCIQPRYNLLFREYEDDLFPLCVDQGVGVIAYNPLAGGLLTGKYRPGQQPVEDTRFTLGAAATMYQARYWHDSHLQAVERLKEIVKPLGQTPTTAAVAWVLQQPWITSAIVGASRPEQLADSLAATEVTLDAEALASLDELWYLLPRPTLGSTQAR